MVTVSRSGEKQRKTAGAASGPTGIPGAVQARFEAASGLSFEDVRVHYNSPEPAQLNAYAYTRGNQVYIGPGQERHLEHELGHVLQQKRGLVRAEGYIGGLPVNRDPILERAADLGADQPAQGFWRFGGGAVQMTGSGWGPEEEEEEDFDEHPGRWEDTGWEEEEEEEEDFDEHPGRWEDTGWEEEEEEEEDFDEHPGRWEDAEWVEEEDCEDEEWVDAVARPSQIHHYATNKNAYYTQQFQAIIGRYGLNLDEPWNKEALPHQGRHPNSYHQFVLDRMREIDQRANGDRRIFLRLFETKVKSVVRKNPDMLYS